MKHESKLDFVLVSLTLAVLVILIVAIFNFIIFVPLKLRKIERVQYWRYKIEARQYIWDVCGGGKGVYETDGEVVCEE